jgi:hypothetical protein
VLGDEVEVVPVVPVVVVATGLRRVVVVVDGAVVVVGLGRREPSGRPATTWPDQKLVSARAPAQDNEMCTWSVCGLEPEYACQPESARYAPQI